MPVKVVLIIYVKIIKVFIMLHDLFLPIKDILFKRVQKVGVDEKGLGQRTLVLSQSLCTSCVISREKQTASF